MRRAGSPAASHAAWQAVFYSVGHTGVIFDYEVRQQRLLQVGSAGLCRVCRAAPACPAHAAPRAVRARAVARPAPCGSAPDPCR